MIRVRSDNGTNFIGADREMRTVEDFLNYNKIQSELFKRGIEWIFNCLANPHSGGCWKRLVHSISHFS